MIRQPSSTGAGYVELASIGHLPAGHHLSRNLLIRFLVPAWNDTNDDDSHLDLLFAAVRELGIPSRLSRVRMVFPREANVQTLLWLWHIPARGIMPR